MKKLIIILVIIISPFFLFGKIVSLPEIVNPDSIIVNHTKLFITEDEFIYIYSLEDFELLKKFGKKGQGPGEFLTMPAINIKIYIQNDYLFVNSISKLSIFTKSGEYVKEIRAPMPDFEYQPLGKMFVGSSVIMEDKVQYLTINLYDANFEKKKEIYRQKSPFQPQSFIYGFNPLTQSESFIKFYSRYDKIFVNDENGIIHVFSPTGKELFSIKHDYNKLKVIDKYKEEVYDFYKSHPGTKMLFDKIKSKMKFPKYFPVIRDYKVADNKVYVLPYVKKNGKNCFYVFDMRGNLLKKIPVIIKEENILKLFPYSIKDDKVYQLVENDGKWELHIISIE